MLATDLQAAILEITESLKALENTSESYIFVGNILVKKDVSQLRQSLEQKKAELSTRLKEVQNG